jgi:peptidylprolyl isomerase
MRRRTLFARLASTALLAAPFAGWRSRGAEAAPAMDPQNTVYMDLKDGRVVIQLLPDIAPKHVERVKTLCKQGFYDGTVFHRVIEGFMAQGGDPTGTGTGGSQLPNLPAEFSKTRHFLRGTVGAARTGDPNSANSQFFIMFAPAPSLDGQYTIWGQVVSGMEFVDKIKRGNAASNGIVQPPQDKIVHMRLAADVKS